VHARRPVRDEPALREIARERAELRVSHGEDEQIALDLLPREPFARGMQRDPERGSFRGAQRARETAPDLPGAEDEDALHAYNFRARMSASTSRGTRCASSSHFSAAILVRTSVLEIAGKTGGGAPVISTPTRPTTSGSAIVRIASKRNQRGA